VTLDKMESVSLRMNLIAVDKFFESVKRRKGNLVICQALPDHAIAVRPLIAGNRSGLYYVRPTLDGFDTRRYNKIEEFPVASDCPNDITLSTLPSIPPPLFSQLQQALVKNSVESVVLIKLFLEAETIPHLLSSLHSFTSMKFQDVQMSRDCDQKEWKLIARFLLQMKYVRTIRFALEQSGVIDQQFLEDFTQGRNDVALIMVTEDGAEDAPAVYSTRNIASSLSRYSKLWFKSLTVPPEWLLDAFARRLAQVDPLN
ncbi:hypothetical protein PFISCL1PPCAC_3178, partial [Pristionchus fissidentatus]